MRRQHLSAFWPAVLAGSLLAGCSSRDASVRGAVTLDGRPLPAGEVIFHPAGEGRTGYAAVEPDGSYVVFTGEREGLPPGDYIVTVMRTSDPADTADSVPLLLTPARYADVKRSDLRYTVKPGSNRINLELTSP
jgi:hypothetical protein